MFRLHVLPLQRPVPHPDQAGLAAQVEQMRPRIGVVDSEPRVAAAIHGNDRQTQRALARDVARRQAGVQPQESSQRVGCGDFDRGRADFHSLDRFAPDFPIEEVGDPQFDASFAQPVRLLAAHLQAGPQQFLPIEDVAGLVRRQTDFARQTRLEIGRLIGPFQLHGVHPHRRACRRRGAIGRGPQIRARQHIAPARRGFEGQRETLPLAADSHQLLAAAAAKLAYGEQGRRVVLGRAQVNRQRVRLLRFDFQESLVPGQRCANGLAVQFVVVKERHRLVVLVQIDAEAGLAVECLLRIQLAEQLIHRPAPMRRTIPLGRSPAVAAALEAGVRNQVPAVGRRDDLAGPIQLVARRFKNDVVHPQVARRQEPDLEATAFRAIPRRPKHEIVLRPLRRRDERILQAALRPDRGVRQSHRDHLVRDSLAFGPERQAISCAAPNGDVHLAQHGMCGRIAGLKTRASQMRAAPSIAAGFRCQRLFDQPRIARRPPFVGQTVSVGIDFKTRIPGQVLGPQRDDESKNGTTND